MRRCFVVLSLALITIAAIACPIAKAPAVLDEKSVGDLMARLNDASAKRDFGAMRKCYSESATIEIDQGRKKKTFKLSEYFELSAKHAADVKDYLYEPEELKIVVGNESAVATQTVIETIGSSMMPVRSRTEADYTVRIDKGELRIVGVTARVIVASGRSDPLPELPAE